MRSMVNTEKPTTKAELQKENRWLERQNTELRSTYSESEERNRAQFNALQREINKNEKLRAQLGEAEGLRDALDGMLKEETKKKSTKTITRNYYIDTYRKASDYFWVGISLSQGVIVGVGITMLVSFGIMRLVDFLLK